MENSTAKSEDDAIAQNEHSESRRYIFGVFYALMTAFSGTFIAVQYILCMKVKYAS
jgi:hypothetical protein